MANKSSKGTPHHHRQAPMVCSICSVTVAAAGGGGVGSVHKSAHRNNTRPSSTNSFPRIGNLDASFVNIPHYRYPSAGDNNNTNAANHTNNLQQNIHDIESILDDALGGGGGDMNYTSRKEIVSGADMQDASRRMESYVEHATAILSEDSSNLDAGGHFYCKPCLDRIGQSLDTCIERLDEECMVYDKAASSEEERTSLLSNILSMNADTGGLDDIHGEEDEDDAILRAIESFQYELSILDNACIEQENELRLLQNLMQNQHDRSNTISTQEGIVHQELNALEIDASNFGEETNLVSNRMHVVQSEIDAMSRVKLMSVQFNIRIYNNDVSEDTQSNAGRYPTINNLRLAYRTNEKAGLHRDEINAAFFSVAQLTSFILGLYPSLITSTVRIIPIHPCAKILVNLPEGQSYHNLGFDTSAEGQSKHVPTQSIALFLVLLSQLTSHILHDTNQEDGPPFPMTNCTIDGVDVTKLADSNTAAWSSVVFCIAANLRWLSQLEIGQAHI